MKRSREREEELFRKAVAAYEANDLQGAYEYFLQIVEMNGDRRAEAGQYLKKIQDRWSHRHLGMARETPLPAAPAPPDMFPCTVPPVTDLGPPELLGAAPPPAPSPQPAKAAAPQILRRTPHMDLDPAPPVEPGTRLKVAVYTDTRAMRAGEQGEEVTIEAPPEQSRFDLTVWLVVGEPFEVEGPPVQPLTILRDLERSPSAEFTVVRKDSAANAGDTGPVTFSALFAYQGRPCGRVSRQVPLAAGLAEPPKTPLPPPGISVEAAAKPADLSVRIVAGGEDERLFQCIVQTPHLPAYQQGQTGTWRLPAIAGDFVKGLMAQFTAAGASNRARTFALRGAGIQLFEAAPKIFQQVFWEMIDAGKPPRTISIVTEEPYIPWELMVPTRPGKDGEDEQRDPLGVEFLVSRWTSREHIQAPQRIPLRNAWVVAPTDSKLASAEEEAALVLKEITGERIAPASIDMLEQDLAKQGRSLLHFICHGESGDDGSQALLMEKKEKLSPSFLRAMPGVKKAFRDSKPLVFLNACQVGRVVPALIGVGGFAEQFMTLGASGVIAPLWSVKDSVAHQLAVELYQRIDKEPQTPFAEILRDLRKRSYAEEGGEDTWAAYCFYGDPLAARGL
ncbi:MAG TPA: CHAT domain-containing protein [Thermoanaerobaculia bacterium]|nr:CHAT domain-containing protein [Thermoanaerobaculia bacterium]